MMITDMIVSLAQQQLSEHCAWLGAEINKLGATGAIEASEAGALAAACAAISLRVVSARSGFASVVYAYPDELYAFLASDRAPPHLRASVAEGQVVSPDQPAATVERAP